MYTEQDLASRCAKGHPDAQRQLYETYAGIMLGICLRYVCDRATAQDLMEDAFVHVLTHFDRFEWRREGSLKAWLCQVQRNVILSHLRKTEPWQDTISIDGNPQIAEEEAEPEGVRDIPMDELLRMIAELPVGYRTVFNLYVIDGYSHKEIGQLLGIKERTSASQLVHGRRLLASKIKTWRKVNL